MNNIDHLLESLKSGKSPKYTLGISDNRFVLKELQPNGKEKILLNHGKSRNDRFSVIYDAILRETAEIVPLHGN